ncbi:MAG: hypothetical protein RO469_18195 [Thermincola sp.]|jgi:hypothetical protein|nr:hypothetical protein [Thermincola sp.]MDT3702742.1 hypothetical protein [Thermincola sp.]
MNTKPCWLTARFFSSLWSGVHAGKKGGYTQMVGETIIINEYGKGSVKSEIVSYNNL